MRTRSARPKLASQAAIVSRRIIVVALGSAAIIWFIGIAVERIRSAASMARRAVRKWVR